MSILNMIDPIARFLKGSSNAELYFKETENFAIFGRQDSTLLTFFIHKNEVKIDIAFYHEGYGKTESHSYDEWEIECQKLFSFFVDPENATENNPGYFIGYKGNVFNNVEEIMQWIYENKDYRNFMDYENLKSFIADMMGICAITMANVFREIREEEECDVVLN